MADPLSSQRHGANVSQATYLEFKDSYADADKAVADAVSERKDLRAKIKAAGIPLAAFDRSRRDSEKSGETREAEEIWYRRMMAWSQKPVGFQASMDLAASAGTDPGLAALSTSELKRIDMEGYEAGKGGRRKDSNSYTPGTEAYQRWDVAWLRGQAEIASTLGDKAPKRGKAAAPAPNGEKRGRGRPRGSRNAPKLDLVQGGEQQQPETQH